MKLLVTGRSGQLARSLGEQSGRDNGIEFLFAARPDVDLSVPGSVADAIRAASPDLVVNAAAYTEVDRAADEPDLANRVNADAAAEAAAAAAELGIPIIQLSTDYVFDGQLDRPYAEGDAVNPIGAYGRSKLAGEQSVAAANPRHLILRTAWVYSPFGRNFVRTMVAAARDRDSLNVVDDQHGSPTSALDLADAILAIAANWPLDSGRIYHIAGSGSASWFELASEVMANCHRLGLPAAEVRPIGTADWPTRAARPRNAVLDSDAINRDLGIRLPDWRQSVAGIVERLS